MLWGGTAYYPSEVLPTAPEIAERGDQIAACLAACKKHGVACHVWKVNFNMSSKAPEAFRDRIIAEQRFQVLYDGSEEPRWLCPSHPANQQLEIDAMVEVATHYDVDGVHFDYIRYPHRNACFCAGCRARFEAELGRAVDNWPGAVRADAELDQAWLDFRRAQITKVVQGVHDALEAHNPGVQISAAVFRNYPVDRDHVGQDWKLWCERGWLDFVCPMDYLEDDGQFDAIVAAQQQWAGGVPCYPGIGLSCWPDPVDAVKLVRQIQITRKHGCGGFTVFNYGVPQANEAVPLCGLGVTRPR